MLPTNEELIEVIKARKSSLGLTNQQISEETGIPLSNVKKYLAGDIKNPGLFYMAMACKYLGISLDELFDIKKCKSFEQSEIEALRKEFAKERKIRIITTAVLAVGIVISMFV